jgi:hypothetical protein
MTISQKDKQELNQIFEDYGKTYGGKREDYFALLHLTRKFRREAKDVAHQVAWGGNDYGLDAYYIDPVARNLYLYQFKWSENHNLFKDSLERLARDGMARIFSCASTQDPQQNEVLRYLRADMGEFRSLIKRIYIQFVFKGSIEDAENSAGLQNRQEDLESKKHFADDYFGDNPVEMSVEFVSDFRQAPLAPAPDTHKVSFEDLVLVKTFDGKSLYVGFMKLMDLYRMYKSLRHKFFSRNIRAGLSADNPPNKKIRVALSQIVLKQEVPPDVFAFNHNGVTLAAERFDYKEGEAVIKVPRLLNGAQTVKSLERFLLDNEQHPALKDKPEMLERILVLAKVVVADPWSDDFITTVTVCNNQQNPVDPWNLRANDRVQCDFQDKLKQEVSIYYSRQENAFQNALGRGERGYEN